MMESPIFQCEASLKDYWNVFQKHRKMIVCLIASAFVGSLFFALLAPKIYESVTSILPPQSENPGFLERVPDSLIGMASGFFKKASPVEMWVGMLHSKTIKNQIIRRFDLQKKFKVKTFEEAREVLEKMVKIKKNLDGIIFVSVESKDPQMAADIANAFIEELDQLNKQLVMTSGKRMRVFVEERLLSVKKELEKTEEALKIFQEKNKAVQLDIQSQAMLQALGAIKGQITAREVELQTFLSYATPSHPKVEILKTELEELKQQLDKLTDGQEQRPGSYEGDVFIPTTQFPNLTLQYARLLRETKIQQTVFEMLTQQYEMARIQEAKDTSTVQILDVAEVPQKKIRPKRRVIVLASLFSSIFFAGLFAFFLEYLEKIKTGTSGETE